MKRWRCDHHEEGPVFMSAPYQPVCWCCRTPMVPSSALTIVDAPFRNPLLAQIHSIGGSDA